MNNDILGELLERNKQLEDQFNKMNDSALQLTEINKEHQRINGELREENKRLQEELQEYAEENEKLHSIIKEVREEVRIYEEQSKDGITNELDNYVFVQRLKNVLDKEKV